MNELVCPGLPGHWINGWLAGVGATVLDNRIRLHWSAERNVAVLSTVDGDPLSALAASWPAGEDLIDLPIAEHWHQAGVLKRKVNVGTFRVRAQAARSHPQAWTLSSTMTDLSVDDKGDVAHAPFDPAGPGTTKWLHHRLMKVCRHIDDPTPDRLLASLIGEVDRVQDNGLGFDQARLGTQSDQSDKWTDPVVEALAFFGLALLPMRGRGTDGRFVRTAVGYGWQRGWRRTAGAGTARRFQWPAWGQPLDADGVDALLDVWTPDNKRRWPLLGVHAAWQTVAFQPLDRADPTRAYGTERL